MASKKIELMHDRYGQRPEHTCGECCNFKQHRFVSGTYKCMVYGSSSESETNWRRRYVACGHFNKLPKPGSDPVSVDKVPDSSLLISGQTSMNLRAIGG